MKKYIKSYKDFLTETVSTQDNIQFKGNYGKDEYPMERLRTLLNSALIIISELQDITDYTGLSDNLVSTIKLAKMIDLDKIYDYVDDTEKIEDEDKIEKYFNLKIK